MIAVDTNVMVGFVRRGWVELADAIDMHRDACAVLAGRVAVVDGEETLSVTLHGEILWSVPEIARKL